MCVENRSWETDRKICVYVNMLFELSSHIWPGKGKPQEQHLTENLHDPRLLYFVIHRPCPCSSQTRKPDISAYLCFGFKSLEYTLSLPSHTRRGQSIHSDLANAVKGNYRKQINKHTPTHIQTLRLVYAFLRQAVFCSSHKLDC